MDIEPALAPGARNRSVPPSHCWRASASRHAPRPRPPSPASTAEARTVAPFPESGDIDAGTYLVTGYTVPFEITVPDGWATVDGANLFKDDPNHPE